jgi:hypothetical protein
MALFVFIDMISQKMWESIELYFINGKEQFYVDN